MRLGGPEYGFLHRFEVERATIVFRMPMMARSTSFEGGRNLGRPSALASGKEGKVDLRRLGS